MTRLYALLLYLYPPAFRREHGREMLQFVRAESAAKGFASRLVFDVLRSIPREWMDTIAAALSSGGPGHPAPPDPSTGEPMRNLARDVRFSTRLLARSPGFTLAAVATLALGIGANTAIFSLAEAVLLRPINVREPEKLVAWPWTSSYPDFKEYTKRSDVFSGVTATSGDRVSVTIDGASELRRVLYISGDGFAVLGVPAALGRTFTGSDDVRGAAMVGMLSHRYWTARFGRDPRVVGRTIHINGQPVSVVGVADADFRSVSLAASPDVYLPLTSWPRLQTGGFFSRADPLATRGLVWLNVVGRLKDGVTAEQAARAMEILYAELHPRPAGEELERISFVPVPSHALGRSAADVRRFVGLLAGVVTLTLLIGCANLANLLLAKSAGRKREVGVRLALGAGQKAILRQMLVESLVLAVLGGASGLLVATLALQLLGRFELPGRILIGNLGLQLNGTALAVAAGLSLLTGLLFGAAPAWRASRGDVMNALRDQSRGASAGSRLRSTLVAAQVALSLVLLAGSGLFLRSLVRALEVPLGFTVDRTAVASVNLALARFDEPRAKRFYADALDRVAALPGVVSAGWTNIVPTAGLMTAEMAIADYRKAPRETLTFYASQVTPRYFAAAGTRVVEGRGFTASDVDGAPLVAIVNEYAARRYWGGRAIGGRIKPDSDKAEWATIVGIVENTTVRRLKEDAVPNVYIPFNQSFETRTPFLDAAHLFVRTSGDVDDLLPMLSGEMRAVDAAAPIYNVQPFADHVRGLVMPQRMGATLFGFFSLLALSLASIGIYGVASYIVALRTREIGIRMALGANRAAIGTLIVRQGLAPVALGLAAGFGLAMWAGRLAAGLLFDVGPSDPVTLGGVGALLATVALIAVYMPARRASRTDPVTALRHE